MKKIAIVTGANSGMGLATTIAFAKQNIHVVMLCRNSEKGEQEHSLRPNRQAKLMTSN